MKYFITIVLLALSLSSFGQEVSKDGKIYEIKDEKIFLEGRDVTETLNVEEKAFLYKEAATISSKIKAEKEAKLEEAKAKEEEAKRAKKEAEKLQKKKRLRSKKNYKLNTKRLRKNWMMRKKSMKS